MASVVLKLRSIRRKKNARKFQKTSVDNVRPVILSTQQTQKKSASYV